MENIWYGHHGRCVTCITAPPDKTVSHHGRWVTCITAPRTKLFLETVAASRHHGPRGGKTVSHRLRLVGGWVGGGARVPKPNPALRAGKIENMKKKKQLKTNENKHLKKKWTDPFIGGVKALKATSVSSQAAAGSGTAETSR